MPHDWHCRYDFSISAPIYLMINSYLKQYPNFTVVKLGYCPVFGFPDIPPVRFLTKKIIPELLPVIDPVYRHYANKRMKL
jgi:hypothetical protein